MITEQLDKTDPSWEGTIETRREAGNEQAQLSEQSQTTQDRGRGGLEGRADRKVSLAGTRAKATDSVT